MFSSKNPILFTQKTKLQIGRQFRICRFRIRGNMWLIRFNIYYFFTPRRTPRWLLWCICHVPLLAKQAEQNLHLWGFSPVWILLWSERRSFVIKPLPHTSHLNFFWSLGVCWACICLFITDAPYSFPHCVHGIFSWTFFMWSVRTI